jgi:hypothetical protein
MAAPNQMQNGSVFLYAPLLTGFVSTPCNNSLWTNYTRLTDIAEMLQAEQRIESGRVYLVNYFGQFCRAKALWPSAVPRGWWHCRLVTTSEETLLPEESFIQECREEQ